MASRKARADAKKYLEEAKTISIRNDALQLDIEHEKRQFMAKYEAWRAEADDNISSWLSYLAQKNAVLKQREKSLHIRAECTRALETAANLKEDIINGRQNLLAPNGTLCFDPAYKALLDHVDRSGSAHTLGLGVVLHGSLQQYEMLIDKATYFLLDAEGEVTEESNAAITDFLCKAFNNIGIDTSAENLALDTNGEEQQSHHVLELPIPDLEHATCEAGKCNTPAEQTPARTKSVTVPRGLRCLSRLLMTRPAVSPLKTRTIKCMPHPQLLPL